MTPGPKPFDQHVRLFEKPQHQFDAFRRFRSSLQDGAAVAVEIVFGRQRQKRLAAPMRSMRSTSAPISDSISAGQRHRAKPRHLDHRQAGERAGSSS